MAPYRAGPGGGMFGSSVYPDSRPKIDVGGAIDAITGGASSFVRQSYLQRQAQNEMTLRQNMEADRRNQEQQANTRADAEFEFKKEQGRRADIAAGWVPEQTTRSVTPGMASVSMPSSGPSAVRSAMTTPPPANPSQPAGSASASGSAQPSAVRRALTPVASAQATADSPLSAPVATPTAPPSGPATAPLPYTKAITETTTPAHFDATKGAKYQQATDVQSLKNTGRLTMADVDSTDKDRRDVTLQAYKQQNIELAGRIRDQVNAHIAGIKAGSGGKPMTPTQRIAAQRFVFGEIGRQSNGNPDEAANILSSDGALSATAKSVGIGEDEVRRAAAAFGTKANEATDKDVLGVVKSQMSFGGPAAASAPAARAVVTGNKTAPVSPGTSTSPRQLAKPGAVVPTVTPEADAATEQRAHYDAAAAALKAQKKTDAEIEATIGKRP